MVKAQRHAQKTTKLISSDVAQSDCAAKPAALALPVPKPSELENDSVIYDDIFTLLQIKSRASYDHEQQQQHVLHSFLAFLFFGDDRRGFTLFICTLRSHAKNSFENWQI